VDRRDEVALPVSEDHWAGFDLAQLQGAFPEERRYDSDKGLTGQDAQEIFDLLAAGLQDAAHPEHLSKYPAFQANWLPPDAAQGARPASLQSGAKSDVQSQEAARTERPPGAPERQPKKQPQGLPSFPPELAGGQPVQQALRAKVQPLAHPASAGWRPRQIWQPLSEPGAQSLLSLPQSSPLPPLLPPLPNQGNVSVPARRARYQSNSSASSSL
jgi:hypothetical protein